MNNRIKEDNNTQVNEIILSDINNINKEMKLCQKEISKFRNEQELNSSEIHIRVKKLEQLTTPLQTPKRKKSEFQHDHETIKRLEDKLVNTEKALDEVKLENSCLKRKLNDIEDSVSSISNKLQYSSYQLPSHQPGPAIHYGRNLQDQGCKYAHDSSFKCCPKCEAFCAPY